jgi:heat shock 70kDa protein 4
MAKQAERPKNVDPATTSAEILKRRDEVVFFCNSILNKPKPRAPKVDTTQEEQPKKEEPTPMETDAEEPHAEVLGDELD